MFEIEIDGKKLKAQPGQMIIQVADEAGIYIPRYCYHKKLSIAASCRMCLVEVEKAPKTLPACATPVTEGMKVYTQSEKTLQSQRVVMEFLLINHPLDCPVCDQGGECELQDLAMGFGSGISRFTEGKRVVEDNNLGPLIASDMTRCIQCTRCVRYGKEIAGVQELGAMNRGEKLEISTFVEHAVKSEMSGCMIDVCPVGALTNKPYRFTARSWEMTEHPTISIHDCVGTNIYVHSRGVPYSSYESRIMRAVPRENEAINETWAADRDRYSCHGLNSDERLVKPRIKENGQWHEVDWSTALKAVKEKLSGVIEKEGARQIAAVMSPSSSIEEFYLMQKWLRGLGSNNIDHRLQQTDFSDDNDAPLMPSLDGLAIGEIEKLDAALLVGCDLRREQPIINQRLFKAKKRGAKVAVVNTIDYEFNYLLDHKIIASPQLLVNKLSQIVKVLLDLKPDYLQAAKLKSLLSSTEVSHEAKQIAEILSRPEATKTAIFLGAQAQNHRHAAKIKQLAALIAELSNSHLAILTIGANSPGAWLAGAIPHRGVAGTEISHPGKNLRQLFEEKLKAYVLFGLEPEHDVSLAESAKYALDHAETVIMLTAYRSKFSDQYADIMLPLAPFTEIPGTYVNIEGRWQTVQAACLPQGQARPGWKILRVFGNLFDLPGFDYAENDQILEEARNLIANVKNHDLTKRLSLPEALPDVDKKLWRIANFPMYRIDPVVRRSEPLQKTISKEILSIRINQKLADKLRLAQGDWVTAKQDASEITLPLIIDNSISDDAVALAAAIEATAHFGEVFGDIELKKA